MLGAPAGRTNWRDKKKKEEIFKKVFVRISSLGCVYEKNVRGEEGLMLLCL